MYGVGVIIFWIISAVLGLASLTAIRRRLPVRILVAGGLGLFIVFAMPAFDEADPLVGWLVTPPVLGLAALAVIILAMGPRRADARPPQS